MDNCSNEFLINIIEDIKFEVKTAIAIDLLDILDDIVISEKTGLSFEFIKKLRKEKEIS